MAHSYRIAVVDTETTGLYPSRDRLVEIAVMVLEVDGGTGRLVRTLETYQELNDPGMPIPSEATAIHGITDAMVKGRRIDAARVARMLADADLVVAHNSGFDKGFVRQLVPGADALVWGCSCRGIPWRKLYAGTAHRAMGDVETTVNLIMREDSLGNAHLLHLITHKLVPRI